MIEKTIYSPKLRWGFRLPISPNATHKDVLFLALKQMCISYPLGFVETKSLLFILYGRMWTKSMIGGYNMVIRAVPRWSKKELTKTRFFFEWLWLKRGNPLPAFPYDEWEKAVEAVITWIGNGYIEIAKEE